jgi:integrase
VGARPILTDIIVRRMRPPASGRREVWDAALPGFGLRVTPTGRRSWVLCTRLRGRPVRLTFGAYPAIGLAAARDLARDAILAIAKGNDPRHRTRATAPDSVAAVGAQFIALYAKPRKRSWAEDERMLRVYVVPQWGTRRLREIGRQDVVTLLDHIVKTNGPIQANRVAAVTKTMFGWALNRGIIDAHPAAGLAAPSPEHARERVLTDAELTALWRVFTAMTYPWGVACRLLLLTACRPGEVEAMAWAELDLDARVWEIPGSRYKTGRPHVVPLVPAAIDLLTSIPKIDDTFVFSTRQGKPMRKWSGAVERATALAGVTGWTPHDLRRTTRTGLSKLGIPADIGEKVLGHVAGGVRKAYDHHSYLQEKRDALERWALHVAQVVGNG